MRVTEQWWRDNAPPEPLPPALRAHPGGCTEAEFQRRVVAVAKHLGWRVHWTHRSDRSPAGWPDLILVRERMIVRELKTDGGRVRKEQREWLEALTRARVDASLWRPRHWGEILTELA